MFTTLNTYLNDIGERRLVHRTVTLKSGKVLKGKAADNYGKSTNPKTVTLKSSPIANFETPLNPASRTDKDSAKKQQTQDMWDKLRYNQANPTDPAFKSPEEEAEYAYDASLEDTKNVTKDLFGSSGVAPTTIEDQAAKLTEQQQKQREFMMRQSGLASGIESSQIKRAEKESAASTAAAAAAMAQGREGAMAGTAPTIVQEFQQTAQGIIKESKDRISLAESQRDQAKYNMENAQGESRVAMADAYKRELARTAATIRDAEDRAAQSQSLLQNDAMKMTTQASDTLAAMGTNAEGLSIAQLQAMTAGTTLTMPQALALQKAAVLNGKALETKNEAEAEKMVQEAEQLKTEVEMGLYGPSAVQEYQYYQKLDATGQAKYKELLALQEGTKLIKYTDEDGNEHVIAYNSVDGSSTEIQTYEPGEFDGEFSGNWGTSTDALNVADGVPIDPTTGEPAIDSWNDKVGSVQCGQFVNSYTGLGMGNDYDSKMAAIKPYLVGSPQVGDVFVSPYEDTGHAGFITAINDDGTVTVKDANWGSDGQISTHKMSTNGMKFARPTESAGLSQELELRLGEANIGVTPSKVKENKKIISNALKLGGEEAADKAILEIERDKYLDRTTPILDDFDDGIKNYEDILSKYNQMQVVWDSYLENPDAGATFVDQALISLFNKITDPGSVVRESEFNRTGESLGFSDKYMGKLDKMWKGGAGLTDQARKDSVEIAKALTNGASSTFDTELTRARRQADIAGVPEQFALGALGLNEDGEFLSIVGEAAGGTTEADDLALLKSEMEKESDNTIVSPSINSMEENWNN